MVGALTMTGVRTFLCSNVLLPQTHHFHGFIVVSYINIRYEWPCRCSSKFRVAESDLLAGFDRFACATCGVVIRVLAAIVDDADGAPVLQQTD